MAISTDNVLLVTLVILVIAAAAIDLRSRRIPNLLTLGGALAGFCLQAGFHGLEGIQSAAGGWAVGFALLVPGYALRQTGAGDVKLMAAVGTFLGPAFTLLAAIYSILVGAGAALALALSSRGIGPWRRYSSMFLCLWVTGRTSYIPPQNNEVMARSFPYGLAIAAGTLAALGQSALAGSATTGGAI